MITRKLHKNEPQMRKRCRAFWRTLRQKKRKGMTQKAINKVCAKIKLRHSLLAKMCNMSRVIEKLLLVFGEFSRNFTFNSCLIYAVEFNVDLNNKHV